MLERVVAFVNRFVVDPVLQQRIVAVLHSLPREVLRDLLQDERFRMAVYDVNDPANSYLQPSNSDASAAQP